MTGFRPDDLPGMSRRSTEKTRRSSEPEITDLEKTEIVNVEEKGCATPEAEVPPQTLPSVDPTSAAAKRSARYQLFSLYFTLFLAGWDGGTPGPLIPRMQEVYNVRILCLIGRIYVFN